MSEISDKVQQELLSWPGVTIHDHRFGGIEFRVNGREMGHIHGDRLADLPFPRDIGKKLIAEGKALPHHVLPQSGWISYSYIAPRGFSIKLKREGLTEKLSWICRIGNGI